MSLRHRHVLWLYHLTEDVNDVECLREPYKVTELFNRARTLTALQIADAWRTGNGREHDVTAAYATGARRIACYELDFGGNGLQCLGHDPALDVDHLGRVVNSGTSRGQHRSSTRRKHAHTLPLEHFKCGEMYRLDLVVREDSGRLEGIDQVAVTD